MNANPINGALRAREQATVAMLRQIDDKIARLRAARAERLAALQRIRSALARAAQAGPVATDHRVHDL